MHFLLRSVDLLGNPARAKSAVSPAANLAANLPANHTAAGKSGAPVLPPYFKLRPKSGLARAEHRFELPASISESVARLAHQADVPPFIVYLASLQALLFRYTIQDEICLGVAIGNRAVRERDNIAEPQRRMVSVGAKPTAETPFLDLLGQASQAIRLAQAPAHDQGQADKAPAADSVFRSAFVYLGTVTESVLGAADYSSAAHASPDFSLVLTESTSGVTGGVSGTIEFNPELYTAADIQRITGHYLTFIEHACQAPQAPLAHLPLLTPDEHRQIVFDWNRTAGRYPSDTLIQQGFEERAQASPGRIAVVAGGREFTYGQIDQRANQLAHLLIEHGVGPGTFVGICLKRSEEMIIAVLASLKAGGAYVPLDTAYPKDRLAFMLKDTGAPIVITLSSLIDRLPDPARSACHSPAANRQAAQYLCLDQLEGELATRPCTAPARTATPEDRCYVIFTSGSTGRPKGVVLRHEAVTNVLDWVNLTFATSPEDRLLFVTSLSFDLSVYDIFGVLGAGGSVRVANEAELGDPATMLNILKSEPITIWDSAPAALSRLAPFFKTSQSDSPSSARLGSSLRLVLLSGDWIPVPLPDQVRGEFPGTRVISLGGATEAAVWSNWYGIEKVDPAWPSIPYGKPIRNARYHILDARLKPVPVGVPGELHIGGGVLAEGYLHREELTRARFIDDPLALLNSAPAEWPAGNKLYKTGDLARYLPDGNIEFLGRIDTQVKVRGFRVEAGEIESVLQQQVGVQDAVVKPHKDAGGQNYLVAYVVAKPGHALTPESILEPLHKQLPDYMVPQQVVLLAALPVTQNGKVDRAILAAPAAGTGRAGKGECVPPTTDAERALVAIWEEVLSIKPIGVTDDFNDLGGHSLTAAMIMALVESRLGHQLPIEVLLSKPTVRGLAEVITSKLELGGSVLIPLQTTGTHPPLFLIAGAGGHVFAFHAFARRLGQQFNVYGMRAVGIDGTEPPLESIPAIAARYLKEIRAAKPDGPYVLSGYSIGGIIAFELAQQMQAAGMQVSRVIVFDLMAPGYPKRLPLSARIYLHARRFLTANWGEKRTYLIERAKNISARVMSRFGHYRVPAGQIPGIDVIPHHRVHAVLNGLLKGWARYWPQKPFDGQIVMMSSTVPEDWVGTVLDDPCKGWSRWTTQPVKLYSINAPHTLFFREGYVGELALRVREVLESAKLESDSQVQGAAQTDQRAYQPDQHQHDNAGYAMASTFK